MQNATNKERSQPDGRFKVGCPDGDVTVADKRVDRFQCLLRTVPAAEWAAVGWVLRSQGSSGGSRSFRAVRHGGMIASNACSGPFPLMSSWCGAAVVGWFEIFSAIPGMT